ncbi:30S ribosomal protein THX [Nibrella saemangeumensis]
MGKGDRKSKRGKIWRGTFGNTRRPAAEKGQAEKAAGQNKS